MLFSCALAEAFRKAMDDVSKPAESSPSKIARVTLRDVAKRLGVSHVTVSLALRNHPSIPEKRRDEVKRVAQELGYRPDPLLSSLAVYRSSKRPVHIHSSIVWLNHWDQPERLRGEHQEFEGYWRGASKAAERFGYHLEEIQWTPEFSAERFERILLTRNVRGLLIPPHYTQPDWGTFNWSKFSVIRFGMSVRTPDSHLVTADQQRAVIMALKQISNYGYERIGMVIEDQLDLNVGGNYTGGFYAAQKLLRMRNVMSLLIVNQESCRTKPAQEKRRLQHWLEKQKPDAILTTDATVLKWIRELGYRIPKDLAVAGTSTSDIPIDTGINQNSEAIGEIAVEMLVAQINVNQRGEPPAPCRILVESLWRDGTSLPRR